MSELLVVQNLTCGYGPKTVLKDVSFDVEAGELLGIVGPNGSGKTTLLRAVAGLLETGPGAVFLKGKDIKSMKRRDIARLIAFVPQLMEPTPGFSVQDIVLLGRTPYLDRFAFEDEKDYRIAKWAIGELKVDELADRDIASLSGGEFQRVAIARALAQEPKIMLLDEPTSHLDLRFQIKILRILKSLRQNRTMIATFHDLNLAARFCRKIVLLKNGEIVEIGRPEEVLTNESIWDVYRVRMDVRKNPKTGKLRINLR